MNRMVKDVVCFHAEDFEKIIDRLKIDIYEPPISQVSLVIKSIKIILYSSSVYNGVMRVNSISYVVKVFVMFVYHYMIM